MKRNISTVVLAVVAAGVVTLIVIGAVLNRVVKKDIDLYGPQLTQTSVGVDTVELSLLTGSAKVKGLILGNPAGCHAPNAITVGVIAAGLSPFTVFSQKVVFRSIRIESPEITFEGGLKGNNWGRILDNVDAVGKTNTTLSTDAAAQPESKKYEVDDLAITGAKVQVVMSNQEPQMISLSDIHVTNLGAGGEGMTAADLAQRILAVISSATVKSVASTADNLDKNIAGLKQAGVTAGKQSSNTVENVRGK